ncbi:hypothetical protein ACIPMW_15875 [Streptomyces sp. NPDC086669]|uniref:hypothetical protein n=1 Tax=Streptomyces sp. NPDC086669 TaxID=3365753 RepID=UPI0037F2E839
MDRRPAPLADKGARLARNRRFRSLGIPYKACSRCFAVKALSAFNRHPRTADGRQSLCRTCTQAVIAARRTDPGYRAREREYAREYHAANTDKRREYAREYTAQGKSAASLRKRRVRLADRTPEQIAADRARLRPNGLKTCRKCREALPFAAFAENRTTGDGLHTDCRSCDTSAHRRACLAAHGAPESTACYLCGERNHADAHADHLIPVSLGEPLSVPSDHPANLRWTHALCNISRGNSLTTADQYRRLHPELFTC